MMKKSFFLWLLLLTTIGAFAQNSVLDKLQVKTSFKLGSKLITSITDDTTGSVYSPNKLMSEQAIKLFVTNRFSSFSSLPSQTGQAGKYLTTNGSTLSWATVAGGGGDWASITGKPTTLSGYGITDNITLQGNSFNAANQLLQLNSAGALPAIDAGLATGLNATNLALGTVPDARLSSNVVFNNSAQTLSNSITATSFIKSGSNSNAYLKGDGSTSTIYYGYHPAVYVATAAALPNCTYSNGTSGIGATLIASSNGALSVDGIATTTGMNILVKNQTNSSENGIYTVTQTGSGASVFILTRRVTEDEVLEMDFGFLIYIQFGTSATFTYSFSNNVWIGFNPTNAPTYNIIFTTYIGAPGSFSGDVIMQATKKLGFNGSIYGEYISYNGSALEFRNGRVYFVRPGTVGGYMMDIWDAAYNANGSLLQVRDNSATYLSIANASVSVGSTIGSVNLIGSVTNSIVTKSTSYTATVSDNTIKVTAASITITLPTAVGITGRQYNIINASSGSITLATTSSQTIGNFSTSTTLSIPSDGSYSVISDGANWLIKSKF